MFAERRGRITAIILASMVSSALRAAEISAAPTACSSGVNSVAEHLLRNSENSAADSIVSSGIDSDWVLRDDRRMLTVALPPDESLAMPSFKPSAAPALPHVDAPTANDEPADVNDRLVPVPVVHLGWAVVLCAVLFNLGAKVLRIRRSTAI
jgi:hypothetical protein